MTWVNIVAEQVTCAAWVRIRDKACLLENKSSLKLNIHAFLSIISKSAYVQRILTIL